MSRHLSTVIKVRGKPRDGGDPAMVERSVEFVSENLVAQFCDERTNVMSAMGAADLPSAIQFVAATAAASSTDAVSIAVVYAGDFVVSKGQYCVVTASGEKLDIINTIRDAIVACRGPCPKIELQVLIDSACPMLAGNTSKKRYIKREAMQETVDAAADVFEGLMIMWPTPELDIDVVLRARADDSSSDSDSASSDPSEVEAETAPVPLATVTAFATVRSQRLPASDVGRVASDLLRPRRAAMECVATKKWSGGWVRSAPRKRKAHETSGVAAPSVTITPVTHVDPLPPLVDVGTQAEISEAAPEPKAAGTAALRVDAKEFTPPPSEFATHSSTSHYQPTSGASTLASGQSAPVAAGQGQQVPQRPGAADEWAPPRGDPRRGIYYCEICQCDVFGDHNWALHLASEKHKRREILTNPDMAGRLDATQTAMLVNPKNFYKCDVCNVVISGQANILQHVNGSQHKKNAARKGIILPDPAVEASGGVGGDSNPPPPPPPGYVPLAPSTRDPVHVPLGRGAESRAECRICGQYFDSEDALMDHYDVSHPDGASAPEKDGRGSDSSARIQSTAHAIWGDGGFIGSGR